MSEVREVCSIIKTEKIIKEFVATVTVPIGFHIVKNGEDEKYPYKDYISLDSNALNVNVVEEIYPSIITVRDSEIEEQRVEMKCNSKVRAIKLVGPLFFNVVATGFMPISMAEFKNEQQRAVVSEGTAFSTSGTMEIDFDLGYACYECDYDPTWIRDGYEITLSQRDEFIVKASGDLIFNRVETHDAFMAELDGLNTVTINYPFSITLCAK